MKISILKRIALTIPILVLFPYSYATAQSQPLSVSLAFKPELMKMDGKQVAFYELWMTNTGIYPLSLNKLLMKDARYHTVLDSMDSKQLRKNLTLFGKLQDSTAFLPAGATGAIYIQLALKESSSYPAIIQQLNYDVLINTHRKSYSLQGASINFRADRPVTLSAPLRHGPWVAIYEPSWETGHRRVFYTVNGKTRLPGRYAIDFMLVDHSGKYANGMQDSIKNWYGYAKEVLAVAPAEVIATCDTFSESATLSGHPHYPSHKATGNYLILDMGNEQYVFYEHLKPGSIRVKTGDHVKKGDVIAAIGFTGQTTGPHLHLHVANKPSPLGAEGIPFVFEQFEVLGNYPGLDGFGKAPWHPLPDPKDAVRKSEHPAANSVVQF